MICILILLLLISSTCQLAAEDLPDWRNNAIKQRIISFIKDTVNPKSPGFVPKEDRIAVFDNDGTLWTEKPVYFQALYVVDTLKQMAKTNPGLKNQQPYKAIIENNQTLIQQMSKEDLLKLLIKTHSGTDAKTFRDKAKKWLETTPHPELKCQFIQLTYLPMKELLDLLREYDYKIYIVTGGGTEFVRSISKTIYDVPVERIIGSQISTELQHRHDKIKIIRTNKLVYLNDGDVKPINIQRIIGKIPVIAVGNSDGDLAMLQYTAQNKISLPILIWHTDAKREYAYDKESKVGRLDKALSMAKEKKWVIVNMKEDWKTIYADKLCVH